MRGQSRFLLAARFLALVAGLVSHFGRAVQIIAPPQLIDGDEKTYLGQLVFEHNVGCLGKQLRPSQPYQLPVYKSPQFGRAWPAGYTSLCPVGMSTASAPCGDGSHASFTTGRLLIAAPWVTNPNSDTPDRPYSYGCNDIPEQAPEYGDTTMRGNVCLVARGGCTFKEKWANCVRAGASAVLIFNEAGLGDFMIGPDGDDYDPAGHGLPGILTVPSDLYQSVADYVPNVTVLLENDVVPIKPPRNCTAELAARVAELQALGTYESTAGESEVARYTWEQSEQLQCESEVATELSQNKLERDMDDLMSGSTVASHIAMESSDDPYSVCIMEQPCVETWTQFPEYTVAVIVSALVLFLCFVEVTSMFIYGQDAGHMTPRSPRLSFPCIPRCLWLCPHLDMCCLCPVFPILYAKPQEFLNTGAFRYFLYTWPFFPRESDPQITFAARLLVTVVCILVGLMCMLVLGNTSVKYQGMRSGSDVEVAGEAYEKMLSQNSGGLDPQYRKWLNMFVTITVQELSKQIMRRWMGRLHDMTSGERSKWHFVPSLITTVVLDVYVVVSSYFLYTLMRDSGCRTVLDNVLIPFISTIPFVFVMGIIGPYGYIAHNTFGTGKRIIEVIVEREEQKRTEAEAAEALEAAEKASGKKKKGKKKGKKMKKNRSIDNELSPRLDDDQTVHVPSSRSKKRVDKKSSKGKKKRDKEQAKVETTDNVMFETELSPRGS